MIARERLFVKLLVINNLSSGFGGGAIYDFIRAVIEDGDEVVLRSTDGTTDLREFLFDAKDYDLVVASGGDSTVATVAYLLAYTGIPLLPFPAGTANLLALNVLSPNEPHALAKLARGGKTLEFDLGEVDKDGARYGFGIMAGAGFDALIMKNAKPNKRTLGTLAYFSAAVTNPTPPISKISVTCDGETHSAVGMGVLAINFSKIQFDISVTHNNRPRDGFLDIAILKGDSTYDLVPALGAAILDRTGEFPERTNKLEFFRTKEALIESYPPMEMQYDGETTELTTPFVVRVLPRAVRLVVSDEGYDLYTHLGEPEKH